MRNCLKRWRRFIFSKSIEENDDLVAGLVELAGKAFDNVQDVNDPILLVILRNAEKKSFWTTEKNTALCLYLRDRYRGLDAVLAPCAELDFGRCWSENWASEIKKPNTRGSTSEEFEFEAYVVSRQALANAKRNHKLLSGANKAQLKWKPGQTTFASAMSDDLGRVHTEGGDALLLRATATAARSTRGGTTERPTVTSVASITDSLGGSEGALANPDDDNSTNGWNRIDLLWRDKLEKHAAATLLKPTTKEKLLRAFQQFHQHYTAAIRSMATFGGAGLGSEALLDQANSYGQLLTVLRKHARAQELMSDLWEPLLQIGTAVVEGDSPAMIVTPWHPLKLLEMTAKAHQARDVIATISAPSTGHLAALDDFVRERLRSLRQSYYADVSLIREADNVRILVESESSSGYALLQPGFFEAGSELSDRPAKPTAAKFSEIASQYLLQMPHERANFSAVLLDAESEDLAVEITKNLAKQIENQQDLRCDLTVTHENPHKLRRIYERQNRRIGHEIELSLTSEAARNFLSRLRVGIAGLESLGGDDLTKSQDIVMLHDVIARKAKLTWHDAPFATICEQTLQHVPTDVSRRKSQSQGDVTSSVYLTSPSQIAPSQAFLDAIHDATQGKPTDVMQHFIPAQEVDIRSPAISEKLDSAHRLANWVITFDRIADRRLIARTSDNVRILRYFSSPRSVHNVIVSTEFSRDFLRSRLQADIEQVLPDLEEEKLDMLIETIRLRSAKLSGEIVMRGTHWDNYAQELIGIVVTQRELELLLGPKEENCVAMFFLDEFKEWLSLSGEVADILAVAFSVTPEGKPQLRLIVSEAKFINQEALFDSRKKSWSQLENTYEQIVSRFACPSVSIGSNIWRAHLAALLLEHMDPWPEQKTIAGMTFDDWVTYIRCGPELAVEVSGHSVICVHDLPSSEYDLSLKVADADQIGTERRRLAQWTLGSDRIKRSIGRLAEVRAEPLLIEPKEWANAPSFVVEGKKGSRQFGAPVTDGDGNAPLSSPQNGLQDGESDQASRRLEAQAESTDDSIDGTLNNSKDQQGDAQASVRDAGLVSNEPIGGAPHESTDGSPLVGDREEPASSIDSGKFVDVPAGWDAQVYATLREMLRNEEGEQGQEWLEEQVTRFQQSIQAEGKAAPVISARLTPNSGLVYVNARDITVRWLERNKVDLMTRYGVEIVRVTGLPGQIAVALKRPKRAILHLADAWLSRKLESGAPRNNTALVIGEKEDDGNLLYLSLERGFEGYERAAPHTIISGTTGSGKGILVSNLILDICAFNDPHAIEIHLIDPKKGADYLWAKDLPHLRGGIIHDKGAAVECLDSLVNDMDRRYALITEAGHPNIDQYNRHHSSEARIPRTIIFFDEVANWMLDDGFKKEVERLIDQVATKSRAAGLHLFMIYQRADNKVMTMQLRTNLGNKLVLRLGDEGSSKIALGERGAERLLGKGHVIAKLDSDEKIYAQVPFIQSDEASRLAEAIARAWK